MSHYTGDLRGAEFVQADLTGARLRRTRLRDARLRLVDLSGVVMRGVSLAGAAIDADDLAGLVVNDVAVGPLITRELERRYPARALRRAADPDGLRAAWAALERSWGETTARVAALPDGSVDVSVEDEWTFTETLRHLVFATDAWLGAARGTEEPLHPWGLPFTDLPEFIDGTAADLGIDPDARPSYAEVVELRADRMARTRAFLAELTPADLTVWRRGPAWADGDVTTLDCLHVLLNEECEHLRFADRDLALIAAGQLAS